jgi:heat shock protein HslJ
MSGERAPLRATGNEPGWRLELGDAEVIFVAHDGDTRIVAPTPAVEKTEGSRKYVTKGGGKDLTVRIMDRPCSDTMTGMPHPNTVSVLFEGKTLPGCGGDPAALLRSDEWVVEDITGVRLADQSRITLAFAADGRVSGKASCNRYGAEYSLTGEGLAIAKGFTTRMACDPPLMNQEAVFLEVLGKVQRFEMGPNGKLILHTGDRRTITARRG